MRQYACDHTVATEGRAVLFPVSLVPIKARLCVNQHSQRVEVVHSVAQLDKIDELSLEHCSGISTRVARRESENR